MNRRLATAAVALCCVAGASSSTLAQTPVGDRPFRGLFGGSAEVGSADQTMEVTATFVQAYDDNLLAESGSVSPGYAGVGGYFTLLQAGGQYGWSNRTIKVGLTGDSNFRYFSPAGRMEALSYSGAAGLSATLARRTTLLINQSASYSPSYLFGLFPRTGEAGPGDAQPTAPDYTVDDSPSYSYATTATMSHGLSRRSSVSAAGDYTFVDYASNVTDRRDMVAYGLRADFSRQTGPHTSVSTGYRYRTGSFGNVNRGSASEHGLDFGMSHVRVLSPSRQARFGFGLGVSTTDSVLSEIGTGGNRLYRLVGNAAVDYQFLRSWQARAAYRRGLEYVAELTEPVFVGGLTASVEGLITRRVNILAAAGYSSGESALHAVSTFDTYTTNVRSHVALTRSVAVHLEYLYYVYDFTGSHLLRPALPSRLHRHGVRAGLTLWAPLFRR